MSSLINGIVLLYTSVNLSNAVLSLMTMNPLPYTGPRLRLSLP